MASSTPSTIVLRSNNPDNMMQRIREAKAAGAITPGMLIEKTTSGTVQAHSTASGVRLGCMVAIENPYSDHGSGKAIDHAYATNETVYYIHAQAGDELYMHIEASATITIGDTLESNGAGMLQEVTIDATKLADSVVGYASNAVTTSGSAGRVMVDIA